MLHGHPLAPAEPDVSGTNKVKSVGTRYTQEDELGVRGL